MLPLIASGIGAVFSPFGFDKAWAERLLTGIIELTSGVSSLGGAAGSFTRSMALAAFMLGWAGLSIHCQVLSFIGDSGLSVRTYIYGKILQGCLSAVFAYFMAQLFRAARVARRVPGGAGQNAGLHRFCDGPPDLLSLGRPAISAAADRRPKGVDTARTVHKKIAPFNQERHYVIWSSSASLLREVSGKA